MKERGGREVDVAALAEELGMRQLSDAAELEQLCARVIAESPRQREQYRAGKLGLFGYFVGQVMKATGGRANPALTSELLTRLLGWALSDRGISALPARGVRGRVLIVDDNSDLVGALEDVLATDARD